MKIKVTCPSCSKVIELDASKIPPKPVTFGCPACKTKVPIDGSKIHSGQGASGTPAPAVASAPPAAVAATPPPAVQDEFNVIDHLEIPADTKLPSGLIISEDDAIASQLQAVLEPFGSVLKSCSSAQEARAIATINLPMLIVYVAKNLTPPPFAPMEELFSLDTGSRRRTFYLVVADNAKTLDGDSAFYHGFDLLLASSDVTKADRVLYSAIEFRRSIAGAFLDGIMDVEGT